MPVKVYFDGSLIRIDAGGWVTRAELEQALDEVERLEAGMTKTPDRITDLTGKVDSETRFPDMLKAAHRRKKRQFANAFRSAIVAPKPADLGLARMFQTLNDHPQIALEIFPDLTSALAWIGTPLEADPARREGAAANRHSARRRP